MKSYIRMLLLSAVIELFACSYAPHFLLLNHSSQAVAVYVGESLEKIVEPGNYVELAFSQELALAVGSKRYKYAWRAPAPAEKYMEFGRPTERFALSIEPDSNVYARLISDGRPSNVLPSQPSGFPLKPITPVGND